MAITGFGVTELNLIGSSGTPKIESPNNLNLNAVTVAISTNATVGGTATFGGDVDIADTIYHTGDSNTKIRFPSNDTISLHTGGNEQFRIDSSGNSTFSGNVGISTDLNVVGIFTANYVPGWTNSVTRTINTKLQDVVYVKDFGAIGDGSTDDTTALQNAINYVVQEPGKELVINAGIYSCSSTITATLNAKFEQLHIRGGGNAIIKFTPSSNVDCLVVDIDTNHYASDIGAPRVSIKDLEFAYVAYGGTANGYGAAVKLDGANIAGRHTQMCTFDNCRFVPFDDLTKTFSVGVKIEQLHEVSFSNCSFYSDNNASGDQINTGVQIVGVTTVTDPAHYYFNNSTFLYGNCGIRVEQFVEGVYVSNCGFVASDNGIFMDSDGSTTTALEPGLHVINSHFNCNTSEYGYGVKTEGAIDINLTGNLFYSGRDIAYGGGNPGSPVYRGAVFLDQAERINITGNNFQGIGSATLWSYSNYHNTAVTVGTQTNTTLSFYGGTIQSNVFTNYKGPSKVVWLQENTQQIHAIPTLNVFNDCSADPILNAGVSAGTTANVVQSLPFNVGDGSLVNARWTLGADGSSHYTFTGPGGLSAATDPTIYLTRGQTYEFVNSSGGSHPFQIRVSDGGSAYNTGVTNNGASSGTIKFEVPFAAPNTLVYQCTSHSSMLGNIVVYPSI